MGKPCFLPARSETRPTRAWRVSRPGRIRSEGVVIDGWRFDSKAEGFYYAHHLKLLLAAGAILHVDVHPVFHITPEIKWEADFLVYYPDGRIEVVDVKGFETREFKRKERLFNERHPLAPIVKVAADGLHREMRRNRVKL